MEKLWFVLFCPLNVMWWRKRLSWGESQQSRPPLSEEWPLKYFFGAKGQRIVIGDYNWWLIRVFAAPLKQAFIFYSFLILWVVKKITTIFMHFFTFFMKIKNYSFFLFFPVIFCRMRHIWCYIFCLDHYSRLRRIISIRWVGKKRGKKQKYFPFFAFLFLTLYPLPFPSHSIHILV